MREIPKPYGSHSGLQQCARCEALAINLVLLVILAGVLAVILWM